MFPMTSLLLLLSLILLTTQASPSFHPQKQAPQSSGKVMGYVVCDACLENALTRNSILIPGASVALSCKLGEGTKSFYSASTKTDEQGRFLFELPPQIANSNAGASLCSTKVLRTPLGACSAPSTTISRLTLHGVLQGHRIFGAGPFVYTPSDHRAPTSCSSKFKFDGSKATPALPPLPTFGSGFPFTLPAFSPPSIGAALPTTSSPPSPLFPPFPANPPPLFSQLPPLTGFPQLPNFQFPFLGSRTPPPGS